MQKLGIAISTVIVVLALMIFTKTYFSYNENETISYDVDWGAHSDLAVERLERNGIKYEVNNGIIYIQDKDLNKAQSCCS